MLFITSNRGVYSYHNIFTCVCGMCVCNLLLVCIYNVNVRAQHKMFQILEQFLIFLLHLTMHSTMLTLLWMYVWRKQCYAMCFVSSCVLINVICVAAWLKWYASSAMRKKERKHASHPWQQGSWGQHGAHVGPTGPRWAPCWPHEPCYLGWESYVPSPYRKSPDTT